MVPLDDIKERDKPITVVTLVSKILSGKTLNKSAVKNIITKAWGEPPSLSIVDLEANTFMFNLVEEDTPKRIMEESP